MAKCYRANYHCQDRRCDEAETKRRDGRQITGSYPWRAPPNPRRDKDDHHKTCEAASDGSGKREEQSTTKAH